MMEQTIRNVREEIMAIEATITALLKTLEKETGVTVEGVSIDRIFAPDCTPPGFFVKIKASI